MPVSKQQQGFKGAFLLTDPNTGKGVSITFWETEADMRAGEASGYYQEQIAKFAQVFAGPPTREGYEVSVQV
jgi:heme-degrading monooxygenase HmoA